MREPARLPAGIGGLDNPEVVQPAVVPDERNVRAIGAPGEFAQIPGLVWSRHQSGKFESENTRLIRTGNRYLRYYLMEAACSLAVHSAEYGRHYQRKKAEAKTHAHQRALAMTARKLVRLVDCLLRSNRLYNALGAPTVGK